MGTATTSFISDLKDRFTPYTEWLGDIRNPEIFKADLLAGLTVALVLIPQSMAYADLAGLPAYAGLYASFLPAIVAALFGSSRQLATGPVAVVSLMTASTLGSLGITDTATFVAYAGMLALMVGLFQLSLGLLRLGVLVDFLSHPVVVGFTNAAAIIIASSQVSKLFGIPAEKGDHHYNTIWNLLKSLGETHMPTLIMAAFALFLLIFVKKMNPKLPNVLIAVVITTLLSWGLHFENMGGSVVGVIPEGLPSFSVPTIDFIHLKDLLVAAVIIALLGFVEAISVAKAIAAETRQRLSANQELVGQGLANLSSGVFGGYPISGSFSRSAVNFSAGGRTGYSSIVTGLLVAITLLFLTPLLHHLPQATLAAVIVMAVVNLVKFEPIKHAWKVEPHDGLVAVVVFVVTLFFAPHLEMGIMAGVLLSLGLFLYRTMAPKFVEVVRHEDGTLRNAELFNLKTSDNLSIYRFDGDLYFANAGYLEGKLLNAIAAKPNTKVIILDIDSVDQIDATGEETISRILERLIAADIKFYIARGKKPVLDAFKRSGLYDKIGQKNFFRERTSASKYAKEQLGDAVDIEPILKPIPR
ncbi:MAG: SulP family inorganic anion transporter [Cocleimonas sp.]|nr:SulP family inorganic anion transporter [Cocleimonas sp.]